MKRKIVSIVATAATAAALITSPAMAADKDEAAVKASTELSINTAGSQVATSAVLANPTGAINNLGSAAVKNPKGAANLSAQSGSLTLTHPVSGSNAALSVAAPAIADKEAAERIFKNAEENGKLSHTPTSEGQTSGDKAVMALGIIGVILVALSSLGLANIPGMPQLPKLPFPQQ